MPKLRDLKRTLKRNMLVTLLSSPALTVGELGAQILRYASASKMFEDLDITDVASMYATTNIPLVRYLAAQINKENPDLTILPLLGPNAKLLPGIIPLPTDKDISRVVWMSMALSDRFGTTPAAMPKVKGEYPLKWAFRFVPGTQFWVRGIENKRSPLILLGGPVSRLGVVAHELGHTTQNLDLTPILARGATGLGLTLGGMTGRPEVTGLGSLAGLLMGERRIEQEAEASDIGLEALRRIGLSPEALAKEKERLEYALDTYKSSRLYHLGGSLAVPIQYMFKRLFRR